MKNDKKRVTSFRLSDSNIIKLEYRESLPSTVALAREYARGGYPDRYVIMTENQTSTAITGTKLAEGDSEHGVFISCILRPSFFPSQAGLLGPISAAALIAALEEHTTKRLGIGWVSDIFCEGKKIGGVAIEGKLDSFSSYEYLIVSFAVRLDNANFPPRLTDMIRKVFESENASVAMIIAKTVLTRFFAAYTDIKNPGKMMDIYKGRFILTGKKIKYVEGGKRHICRVVDVDRQTATLTVELRGGEKRKITSPSGVIIPNKIKI